jgi:hypothetical protein
VNNDPLTREQRKRLPKAKLLQIRFRGWSRFMTTRGANWAAVWIGPVQIGWRMPWIPHAARALHPEMMS